MDPAEALSVLVGAKLAAKVCALIGAALMTFGWLRSKAGRGLGRAIMALSAEERQKPRGITRGEYHDLRDGLHTLRWKIQKLELELEELKAKAEE